MVDIKMSLPGKDIVAKKHSKTLKMLRVRRSNL